VTTTAAAEPIYQPGEVVPVYADIYPCAIDPVPAGVPRGVKLRAVCTERCLTLMWQLGSTGVGRLDLPMTPAQTISINHLGGNAGGFHFARGGGCNCGGKAIRGVSPWPGVQLDSQGRRDANGVPSTYGLPSNRPAKSSRFTRIR